MNRVLINIKGVVQGVGFRPFVYNLAKSMNLNGYVKNTSEGVAIDIEGEDVEAFIDRLPKEAPELSEINNIDIRPMQVRGYEKFEILKSSDTGSFTLISPDAATCSDCLGEMLDKNDRRYLYPFINCINCGPRYSITKAVPYDRANTTMFPFRMCAKCEAEYDDPSNRRFHAQPNACPKCGPGVNLKIRNPRFKIYDREDPVRASIGILKDGGIIAVKGLGGFHIACDALNKEAVESLRERKRKSNKPFALMAPDVETAEKYCEVSEEEKRILTSNKRPVVLLRKKIETAFVTQMPEAVAPDNQYLGFMLPYTPLHYLLFFFPFEEQSAIGNRQSANFDALVMTSGNISEEPIVIDNYEAMTKLPAMVDAYLIHNRDIFMRVDDSVVRKSPISRDKTLFIRRSRGYAPDPIILHDSGPEVVGCGADIKNTFTLTKENYAVSSQHIGDMENYETLKFFEESLSNLMSVYRVNPVAMAYDLHPGYLSTKWALERNLMPAYAIQHHYAHVASVMAENGITRKVIGIAFDGTGYGTDGNLWGGEFLIADIWDFKRAGHLRYIPLPGGETAIKEPWRTAVSYIKYIAGDEAMDYLEPIGFVERYGRDKIEDILRITDNREFSPLSSGAGRLFDAVSSMLGICDRNTFEGEAAMALESYAAEDIEEDYPADIILKDGIQIDFSMTILRLIDDMRQGKGKDIIASKFHNTIATVIAGIAQRLGSQYKLSDVVLSGGVFQNMYLLKNTMNRLRSTGMNTYINEKVPANDAGISLGQAYIARERLKAERGV